MLSRRYAPYSGLSTRGDKLFKRLWWSLTDYIRETDKILILLCFVTTSFGCVAVLSSTRYLGNNRQLITQAVAMVLGLAAALLISAVDYSHYKKWWPLAAGVSLLLVGLTFFIGFAPAGTDAKAWLMLPGGITFQPAELLKIAFIMTFSVHLSYVGDRINRLIYLIPVLVHGAFPVLLVHFQGDDGTAIVFGVIMLIMLFMAGLKARYFAIMGGLAAVAAPILYFFVLSDYQKNRILSLFNLEADLQGIGYQQWRGRVALANGGVFGQGLFKGPLTQSGNVPESYNDFIFVSIGEELGFIGCLLVVGLLAAICIKIMRTAKQSRDEQGRLLCSGVFAMFLAQIVINLGMCLSLLPVIGVTLPFFSAGGTSLVCLYLGIGMVLSVYYHRGNRVLKIT